MAPRQPQKNPARRHGRPSKLSPEVVQRICGLVELCGSLEDAAAKAGVSRATVFVWQRKGQEQKKGPYRDFLDAIEAAKAKRRFNFGAQMQKHGLKHWQAVAWLAERTDPKHFGLRIKVHVNEELERMMDKLQRRLTPQEYERALEAISEPDDSPAEIDEASGIEAAGGSGLASAVGAAVDAALHASEAPGAADLED